MKDHELLNIEKALESVEEDGGQISDLKNVIAMLIDVLYDLTDNG